VLHRRHVEEERLEARIEQQRRGDPLFRAGAEERQRGAERRVVLLEIAHDRAQALEAVAERLEVAPQVAGEERTKLAEVGADELIGQDQDVVLEQAEEAERALLL